MDRRRNAENDNANENEDWNWWQIGGVVAGVAAGVAVIAGIASAVGSQNESAAGASDQSQRHRTSTIETESEPETSFISSYRSSIQPYGAGIDSVPENPIINNLNSLLSDIYVRYVALKKDDFILHYRVFQSIFGLLHSKMKCVDKYYNRYSGMVQFAGSHYDRLRIKKPDEFDMDIVIGVPLNINTDRMNHENSDFIIEPTDAGYVQLKMGAQFINLSNREDWEIHKTCYKWKDDDSNYLLCSKFTDWFKSVVVRALNQLPKTLFGAYVCDVDNESYMIRTSESGPAITLKIRNALLGFYMDVDLVPTLRFPESRWPITPDYRTIPSHCKKDFWMVVPKPNKNSLSILQSRSWRLALHYQERELIYNSYNLRMAIKLLKKLRDAQEITKIASYYIKTLVYWEVVRRGDSSFGTKSVADLFKILVDTFHRALEEKNIPYFWNENNNLLDEILPITLDIYANKLKNFKRVLEVPSEYKKVAKFLLSRSEFEEYNRNYLHL